MAPSKVPVGQGINAVRKLLEAEPGITAAEISRRTGISYSHTTTLVRHVRRELTGATPLGDLEHDEFWGRCAASTQLRHDIRKTARPSPTRSRMRQIVRERPQ